MTTYQDNWVQDSFINDLFNEKDEGRGMRLEKLQMFNWGAFDGGVYTFAPNRHSCLITGDSGSGKSTILDSQITLLLPKRDITYNGAADQEKKENRRSKEKYVLGEHGEILDEKQPGKNNKKAIKKNRLRDESTTSILLATFSDSYQRVITIGQVNYFKQMDMKTFYIYSEQNLSIEKDFANYNNHIALKNGIKGLPDTQVFDRYKEYRACVLKALGLQSPMSLKLLQNAAYMKNIPSIDQFIKDNMLEYDNNETLGQVKTVYQLCSQLFEMVDVVKKRELERGYLESIVKAGNRYNKNKRECDRYAALKPYIEGWGKIRYAEEAQREIFAKQNEKESLEARKKTLNEKSNQLQRQQSQIQEEYQKNGGGYINQLQLRIRDLTHEVEKKKIAREGLNQKVACIDYPAVQSQDDFQKLRHDLPGIHQQLEKAKKDLESERNSILQKLGERQDSLKQCKREIRVMENSRSNIPADYQEIRDTLVHALNIPIGELPFAGELIEIKPEAREEGWDMAIEKALYGFALTILVTNEEVYEKLVDYVNQTEYQDRKLQYEWVHPIIPLNGKEKNRTTGERYIIDYLTVQQGPEYEWIQQKLRTALAFRCCDTEETFKKAEIAITKEGQVKIPDSHYEKYDGKEATDGVIGLNIRKRLAQYQEKMRILEKEVGAMNQQGEQKKAALQRNEQQRFACQNIQELYKTYEKVNVEECQEELDHALQEQKELEGKTEILKKLRERKEAIERELQQLQPQYDEATKEIGRKEAEIDKLNISIREGAAAREKIREYRDGFDSLNATLVEIFANNQKQKKHEPSFDTTEKYWRYVTGRVRDEVIENMGQFKQNQQRALDQYQDCCRRYLKEYPQNMDVLSDDIRCLNDYRKKYEQVQSDTRDAVVREKSATLEKNPIILTRNALGTLVLERNKAVDRYKNSIQELNEIISHCPFGSRKRTIEIAVKDHCDSDCRNFDAQLKSAKEKFNKIIEQLEQQDLENRVRKETRNDSIESTEEDSEKELDKLKMKYDEIQMKLQKIADFLEQFNMSTNHDEQYMKKVTDPRNWIEFVFYITDPVTKEVAVVHSSGSQSGGEQESLTYAIMGAAMIYNFKLSKESKVNGEGASFRVIFMDEAFQKSSANEQEPMLKLFRDLDLQVILITPHKELELYTKDIDTICYVANDKTTHKSYLRMMKYITDPNTQSGRYEDIKEEGTTE